LLVSIIGIILATILGTLIGIARLITIRLVAWLSLAYVEIIRNIPLLLQLFFWYFVVLRAPTPNNSISFFDIILLPIDGIYLPSFIEHSFLGGIKFEGGITLLPEFLALLMALSLYTAAYIAEIVRLGIASVEKNQKEAALALGLTPWQSLKLIILPQALKVIYLRLPINI